MPDRFPPPAPDHPADPFGAAPGPAVYDAVYEDVEGVPPFQAAWPEPDEPAPVVPPAPAPAEAPAQDPWAADGLHYTPGDGFRIEPEAPAGVPTRALQRYEAGRPLPAPAAAAPPPPPTEPPTRLAARRAFREKGEMFKRHRGLFLVVFLTVLGAFVLYSALAPKEYRAYSVLLIHPQRSAAVQDDGVEALTDAPGGEDERVLNQALILQQATAIARETAERLLAAEDAAGLPLLATLGGAPSVEEVARYLQEEAVTVERAGEDVDAVRVTATSSDPREAARIAALYTEEYVNLTRSTGQGRVSTTRQFLEEQVARRQGELDEIEHQLATYMTRENAAGLDVQTSETIQQVASLQASLDQARVETRMRGATLGSLERELAGLQPRLAARAASTSSAEIVRLDSMIARLDGIVEQVYLRNPQFRGNPDAHPDLRAMEDRLAGLRREKERLAGQASRDVIAAGGVDLGGGERNGPAYVTDLRRQIAEQRAALEGARASASALAQRLAEASGALRAVPQQSVDLAQLERQRTATAQLLTFLTTRLQETRLAEESGFGLAQVIRPAQVPTEPASPNWPLNLSVGFLLGSLLGLGAVSIRYRTDPKVHTPADLADQGFAVLGAIPVLAAAAGPKVRVAEHEVSAALVTVTQTFSPEAEAFRHLFAGLQVGPSPEVLLVTGPEVGTGKSLVAANLAVVAAQAGLRVLLLDADLRRPTVQTLLGLGAAPALGEGGPNLVYWNTPVPGLFALTAREPATTPDSLWSPEEVARLLGSLRTLFDLIVVDAPPGLVAADAALLAPHADAALLVAAAGQTDADALAQTAAELGAAGLYQVGAVINRFDPRRAVGFMRTFGYRYSTSYTAARRAA